MAGLMSGKNAFGGLQDLVGRETGGFIEQQHTADMPLGTCGHLNYGVSELT
jgi:hypothetical protein